MYAALWRVLPGPTALKVLQLVLLAAVVMAALFGWVFPWAERSLPFLNVTVDQG